MIFHILYAIILFLTAVFLIPNITKINLFNTYFIIFFVFFGPAFFQSVDSIDDINIIEAQCLSLSVFFIFIGKFISDDFLKKWRNAKPLVDSREININILKVFFFSSLIIVFLGLFFYDGLAKISIIYRALDGLTPDDLKELRFETGIKGWIAEPYKYIISFSPGISLLMLNYYLDRKKGNLVIIALLYFFIFLIILAGLATLTKSITFFYLMQIGIFFYLRKNRSWRFNIRFLVGTLIVVLLILLPIYLYLTVASNSFEALELILDRVTGEPNRVLREYFIWFPNRLEHRMGMNIRLVHKFFGKGEYEPAYISIIMQNMPKMDYTGGTWPAIYLADAWVDFSYFGVVIHSFILGITLNVIDLYIARYRDGISVTLFSMLLASIYNVMENSLITVLISGGLLVYPLFIVFITKKRKTKIVT